MNSTIIHGALDIALPLGGTELIFLILWNPVVVDQHIDRVPDAGRGMLV